jgi:hypothetical protein
VTPPLNRFLNDTEEIAGRILENDKVLLGTVSPRITSGTERDQPNYYRVQTPDFLIEFDKTQSNGNHVHSVWRDLKNDFGRDLLKEHYAASHTAAK